MITCQDNSVKNAKIYLYCLPFFNFFKKKSPLGAFLIFIFFFVYVSQLCKGRTSKRSLPIPIRLLFLQKRAYQNQNPTIVSLLLRL